MTTFRTHYDNLKVARDAPDSVIKAAYKALMQQYHPDKFDGNEQESLRIAKLIKHSYDVLIDPVNRAAHDRWINDQEAEAKQQSEHAQFEEVGKATEHQYQKHEYPETPKSTPPPVDSTPAQYQPFFKKVLSFLAYSVTLIATLVLMSIGGMFGKIAGRSAFTSTTPSAEQYEAELMRGFIDAAQKINKQGATIVNDETLMDGATVGPGLRITYHYILRKYTSQNVDPSAVQTNIRTEVTQRMCSNKEMKLSLQYGAIYGYIYAGTDNVEIARFEIDRKDCGFETLKTQQNTPASTKYSFSNQLAPSGFSFSEQQAASTKYSFSNQLAPVIFIPGEILTNGGIVFYVDSTGKHGLVAKPDDEPDELSWDTAKAAANAYGSGWHLPTKDELNLLYLQKNIVGGFAHNYYWCSTEYSSIYAWFQSFNDGSQAPHHKYLKLPVRAVRAF